MIVLNPRKAKGKAIVRLIMSCIKTREENTNQRVTKQDFVDESGISKMTLSRWQRNLSHPSADALHKVAMVLTDWGFNVRIEYK